MSYDKNKHLSEDEFLTAAIDRDDLSAIARDHLSECPQCREQIENFESELATLGRMAERFSPRQRRQVSLTVKPHHAGRWFWGLGTAAGATAMVALTVTLLWWSPFSQTMPEVLNGVTFQETDQLMTDIDKLVDNPLPQVYLYIAGESQQKSENDSGNAVPTNNNITPSYNSAMKGAVVC